MLRMGIIGYGYWGPNIVRNFSQSADVSVTHICDSNKSITSRVLKQYPFIKFTTDYRDVTRSPDIDAISIVTPSFSHYEIARDALNNGKHIFIEKPFVTKSSDAERLISLAEKKKLMIMVDHTFLFTPAIKKIKQYVKLNTLGKLLYYDSTRINLGMFQHDTNIVWDLAPHDFSICDHLFPNKPVALTANGKAHFGNGLEDIAFLTLYYEDDFIAHINLNWLSPVKIRSAIIGGDKKLLLWNNLAVDEQIKMYDKGVEVQNIQKKHNLLVSYRSGNMYSPQIDTQEALKAEAEYFVKCIEKNSKPINDAHAGLRVIKLLEACDRSLKYQGKVIQL